MQVLPCLAAIVLAVAVTFPGCDGLPTGYGDGETYDVKISETNDWDKKDWRKTDVDIVPVPVPIPEHRDQGSNYGKIDEYEEKNKLDKVIENVGYTVSVPGNYAKAGVVSGLGMENVHVKSIFIEAVN